MAHEGARSQSTGVWSTNMPKDKAAWDRHRETIYQLYILEDLTLKGVKCALETKYGFSQYRLRDYEIVLRDYFGFRKNLRSQDWQAIAIHREKRLKCGEQSDVYLYGSLLDKARVDRASSIRSALHIPQCHPVSQSIFEGLPKLDCVPAIPNIRRQFPSKLSVQEIRLHVPFTQFIETTIMAIYKLAVPTRNAHSSVDPTQMPIISGLPQIVKALGYSSHIHISDQTLTLTGSLRSTIERHLNSRAALRSMKSISARFSFERLMYLFSMMSNKNSVHKDDGLDLLDWIESTEVEVLKSFFALPIPTIAATWEALMCLNDILTRPIAFTKLVEVGLSIHKGQWLKARAGDVLAVAIWLKLHELMGNLLSYGLSPDDKIIREYHHVYQTENGSNDSFSFPTKALTVAIICTDVEAVEALLENGAQVSEYTVTDILHPYIHKFPEKFERMFQCLQLLVMAGAPVDVKLHSYPEPLSPLQELGWLTPWYPSWFSDQLWQLTCQNVYWSKAFAIVAQLSKRMQNTATVAGACSAASLGHVQLRHYLSTREDPSSVNKVMILEIALSEAASKGDLRACKSFLQYGVDPNMRHYFTQFQKECIPPDPDNYIMYAHWVPTKWHMEEASPVFRASERADIPLLKLLFEAGADPNRYNLLSSLYSGESHKRDWIEASIIKRTHDQGHDIDHTHPISGIAPNEVENVFGFLLKAGFDVQVYGGEAMAQSLLKPFEHNRRFETSLLQCDWLTSKGVGWDFEIEGRNLLHLALRFSWRVTDIMETIQFLAARGVKVHSNPCNTGYTMLHDAVRRGHSLEVIEFLLNQGADVSCCCQRGLTVLQSVFEYRGRRETDGVICKRLLQAGAPLVPAHHLYGDGTRIHCLGNLIMLPEIEDSSILSLLEATIGAPLCYDADYLCASDLVPETHSDLRYSTGDHVQEFDAWQLAQKRSPLQAAIKARRFDIAKYILRRGVNEQHITPPFVTGLQAAVEVCAQYPEDHSSTEFTNFLLGLGAEVDIHAGNGLTALHRAAAGGSLNTASVILRSGADPNILTKSPYFKASESKICGKQRSFSTTVGLVLYRRASKLESASHDTFAYDRHGRRAFMQPYIPCIGIVGPVWPLRALDLAAITGRLDMVQLLLNAGGISGLPRAGPYDGAIDCAVNSEHHAVACLLRKANIEAKTSSASFEMDPAWRGTSGLAVQQ
ncbi:hypothetical protein G7054_g10295 [Neopestalotiopsis clavispora]|nr:hypothetical protein G7054_g10295 [Neopestalotiopsis clavispora]